MLRLFNNLLDIRPSEGPRLALLSIMLFLMSAGSIWGLGISEALFLKQVGSDFLPWIFVIVVNAIIFVLVLALYTAFADRVANDRLLIGILLLGMAGLAIGRVLLALDAPAFAYPLLYLLAQALIDIFNLHWTTYLLDFYDARAAKRLVPIVVAAARLAAITAGLSMPVLTGLLAPGDIILVWLGILLLVAGCAWSAPALLREPRARVAAPSKPHGSYVQNIREGYRYVARSAFLRWMAISTLLLMVLVVLLTYHVSWIFQAKLGSAAEIANLLGLLGAIANLLLAPFLLFGFGRLINRIGVGNANLIYPAGMLAVCGALIGLPGLPTAALAYAGRTSLRVGFTTTLDGLLFSAVPLRVKGRARVFISGLVVPAGALIGAGLLLLVWLFALPWLLPVLLGGVVAAYLASALMIRVRYPEALIALLEHENLAYLLSQEVEDLPLGDTRSLALLQYKLAESRDHDSTLFIARLISQVGGYEALPILEQAVRTAADARTRVALLDLLIDAGRHDERSHRLCSDLLHDTDPHVRQAALAGLEQALGAADQGFVALVLPLAQDPDIEMRGQVLLALARSGRFYELDICSAELNRMLADSDPRQRAYAIRTLRQMPNVRVIRNLARHLSDPADEVRLETVAAVVELAQGSLEPWIATLITSRIADLVQDPVEHVREVTLVLLGQIGGEQCYAMLVSALADTSPQVRAVAADALVKAGRPAIPVIQPALGATDAQVRRIATIILGRIDRVAFASLLQAEILASLRLIYQDHGRLAALEPYAGYPSIAVLRSTLYEQQQRRINEVFELLATELGQGAPRVIGEALRSTDSRVYANAVEALEALVPSHVAGLITPLFDPALDLSALLQISHATWGIARPDTAGTLRLLLTDSYDPWLRTIATFALGEIGAGLAAHPAERALGSDEQAPADLPAALDDTGPHTEGPNPTLVETPAPFTLVDIAELLRDRRHDEAAEVRKAARAAERMLNGARNNNFTTQEHTIMLSTIEKVLFLKEVPFFKGMTIEQLKVLAAVGEEVSFAKDTRIFSEGDPGGTLYVVVGGQVGLEQERRKGSFARVATIEARSYFGEMSLFDDSPYSATAIALQDTLALCLRREPLIALTRQHPDLLLELIKVLSQRLREANDRIAELTRTRPRELQKLYDQFT